MGVTNQPTIADLPETARVFAEIIGFDATLKLAAMAQYNAVSVPKHIGEKHWIAKAIGYARAQALVRNFAGCLMPLASCKQVAVVVRQNKVVSAYALGTSPAVIADLLGVTIRTVFNDLNARGIRHTRPSVKSSRQPHPSPGLGTPLPPMMRGTQNTPASA